MKLSREIKTAILVIASILLFIWGYSFLKGRDLFANYKTLYAEYENVEGLNVSSPVTINGFTVGKVGSIVLDDKTGKIKVQLQINYDYPIKKNSIAELYAPGPISGKQVAIIPSSTGADTVDGDTLISASKLGITDELTKQFEPLKNKIIKLLDNSNVVLESLNEVLNANTKRDMKSSIENLNETLSHFNDVSAQLNSMLGENRSKINSTLTNVEKASSNFSRVSDSIAKINIAQTVKNLETTLEAVNKMVTDMQAGKGTMGKLLKDDGLYNNVNKTSKELELLLQDLRLNPTRYVNVSVFGKKNKPYVAPNDTINKK